MSAITARGSVFTRLVGAAILVSIALVLILWLVADRTIRNQQHVALERAVDVDLAGLIDIHASGGAGELQRRIADRLAIDPTGAAPPYYLLTDDEGRTIAGNIAAIPSLDPAISESGDVDLGGGRSGYARATRLASDLDLVVGRENAQQRALLRNVARSFTAAGALVVLLVAMLGYLAGLRLKRRIERINHAFRDPGSELLIAPARDGAGDEVDELTRHTAQILLNQRSLVQSYRDMSDQIAHEIRTPLMHLDTRLVKALGTEPDPELAEKLVEARAEIRRLVGTLESLLDISASKARRGDPHGLAKTDLSEIVTRICELYAASAEETGHGFDWHIADDIVVDGEPNSLARLITNLLDNAFKYVPPEGTIAVKLSAGPVIDVIDDGPGIPDYARERIFARFHRVGQGETAQTGSGLGLALARAIAERHGWTLKLVDTPQGAHFRVAPGRG